MNRNKHISLILTAVIAILMTACSGSDKFTIQGKLTSQPEGKISLVYYTSSAVKTVDINYAGGKFKISGESPDYAMAELRIGSMTFPLTFIVRNGDKIEVEENKEGKMTLSGTKAIKKINKFTAENEKILTSGDTQKINALIADYVKEEGATPVSAYLLLTYYDTVGNEKAARALFKPFLTEKELTPLMSYFADQIIEASTPGNAQKLFPINQKGYPDSLVKFSPYRQPASLLVFSNTSDKYSRPLLDKKLHSLDTLYKKKNLRIVDFSMLPDSSSWKDAIKADTLVTWSRIYIPGGASHRLIRPLKLPRVPYYIVADSTATQLYRGASLDEASATLSKVLKGAKK